MGDVFNNAGYPFIDADNAELLASALKTVSGNDDIDPKQARQINSGVRAIAHAVTAQCYQQRDEGEKAIDELDKALDAAEELGVPKGELALLRAYIAFSRDDHAAAGRALRRRRRHRGLRRSRRWRVTDHLVDGQVRAQRP